jgi:hypothetical protein
MITFCQIRRRDFFIFFVSILRVINLRTGVCAENAHNVACPKNGVSFKIKIRKSKKGTCNRAFLPKMAQKCINIWIDVPFLDFLILILNVLLILGPRTFYPRFGCTPSKREKLFPGNKKPRFWDHAPFTPGLVAPPQNAKSFFPETRNHDFGTTHLLPPVWLHPLKTRKAFSRKQETPILGLS